MKKAALLIALNGSTAALLIYLLSPGLFGLFGRPFVPMLIGMAAGLFMIVLCLVADCRLLFSAPKQEIIPDADEIEEEDRPALFLEKLEKCHGRSFFRKDIDAAADQIKRFEKKQAAIREILHSGEKINAEQCLAILDNVSNVFYQNVRSLLNRVMIFDEDEYKAFQAGRLELGTEEVRRQKAEYYRTLADYVDEITDINEEIILQIDSLTLELTRANTENRWDADTILSMRKLDSYIQTTKLSQDLEKEAGESVCQKIRM